MLTIRHETGIDWKIKMRWEKSLTPVLKDRMGPDEYRAYSRIAKIGN